LKIPFLYPSWPSVLKDKRLVLIVTGGVAAFRAVDLVSRFLKAGAEVRVAMTKAATEFVGPKTFEALTHAPCIYDMWQRSSSRIDHISFAEWAEAMVVVPATANFLAKAAQGLADDYATSLFLAFGGPKLVAPAMNSGMWQNPATQANAALLSQRGINVLVPVCGRLASGLIGQGRLPHVKAILRHTARLLAPKNFTGQNLLVTAGSTREAWDDIRYLANRASGQMGLSLAQAAWLMGGRVTLLAGPTLADPLWHGDDFVFIPAETTLDLLELTKKHLPEANYLLMNAAPADFKPQKARGKISKKALDPLTIPLDRNPDILKALAEEGLGQGKTLVGFAAESDDLVCRALEKLQDKKLDYIAANQAGGPKSAFGAAETRLVVLSAKGESFELGPGPKFGVAFALLEKLGERRLSPREESQKKKRECFNV
jgi:phosphopantothenoylcysteine decarboxylase/phosphopantothenate--cysteine ligase